MTDTKEELKTLIRAKYPISWVQTHEEERVIEIVREVADEQQKVPALWTITRGLWNLKEDTSLDQTQDPVSALDAIMNFALPEGAIFVLPDYHRFLQDVVVSRKLRDLHAALKETRKSVVIVAPTADIPVELQKAITVLDLDLPTAENLATVLDEAMDGMRMRAERDQKAKEFLPMLEKAYASRDALVQAGLGLTLSEYENVIAKCLVLRDLSVRVIKNEKKQIIRKNGSLEYFDPESGMEEIGGLACLKQWTRKAKKRYSAEAEEYGLAKPKGVLLVGPPGTGKSLSAKAVANELQLPLIRMDMSDTASKYYGETASNVKAALKVVNTVAPAVFWWDEVEKMFSTGGGAGGEGHEETMRALGTLLTDFEESPAPVLRVATCNSVQNLKPEFMQRFERIFFVDLPNAHEREEIFAIHLRKVRRDPKNYDLATLALHTDGFVGREIRTIIMEALANAFDEEREMTTDDMIAEAKQTTPMSVQKKDEIERMRIWAKANALLASAPETEKGTGRKRRDLEF